MIYAVVFVPTEHFLQHASQCLDYCTARGYQVRGLVRGEWREVLAMLGSGLADVAVIARPDHATLPGAPRIEVAVASRPGTRGRRPAGVSTVRPGVAHTVAEVGEDAPVSADVRRLAGQRKRRPQKR